jgi:anion-transporting  ArsA/GET3 family ATPase
MQDDYMKLIDELFDGQVRAVLPLLETEVRGVPMLQRMTGLLFEN